MYNYYNRDINKEEPWRTNRWGWVDAMRSDPKDVVKYLPMALPKMKLPEINWLVEEGIGRLYWGIDWDGYREDVKAMIFGEYGRRQQRDPGFKLAVVAQCYVDDVLKNDIEWRHFTNVEGIVGLLYKFERLGMKKEHGEVEDMIHNFTTAQCKKLIKTWPQFVERAEEFKLHEKVPNILLLSVYYRNPYLREYLTKEYYEQLKETIFMESLQDDSKKRRTYRETKFFDKWDFSE